MQLPTSRKNQPISTPPRQSRPRTRSTHLHTQDSNNFLKITPKLYYNRQHESPSQSPMQSPVRAASKSCASLRSPFLQKRAAKSMSNLTSHLLSPCSKSPHSKSSLSNASFYADRFIPMRTNTNSNNMNSNSSLSMQDRFDCGLSINGNITSNNNNINQMSSNNNQNLLESRGRQQSRSSQGRRRKKSRRKAENKVREQLEERLNIIGVTDKDTINRKFDQALQNALFNCSTLPIADISTPNIYVQGQIYDEITSTTHNNSNNNTESPPVNFNSIWDDDKKNDYGDCDDDEAVMTSTVITPPRGYKISRVSREPQRKRRRKFKKYEKREHGYQSPRRKQNWKRNSKKKQQKKEIRKMQTYDHDKKKQKMRKQLQNKKSQQEQEMEDEFSCHYPNCNVSRMYQRYWDEMSGKMQYPRGFDSKSVVCNCNDILMSKRNYCKSPSRVFSYKNTDIHHPNIKTKIMNNMTHELHHSPIKSLIGCDNEDLFLQSRKYSSNPLSLESQRAFISPKRHFYQTKFRSISNGNEYINYVSTKQDNNNNNHKNMLLHSIKLPNIVNNFYCQALDWSVNDRIAVIANRDIYYNGIDGDDYDYDSDDGQTHGRFEFKGLKFPYIDSCDLLSIKFDTLDDRTIGCGLQNSNRTAFMLLDFEYRKRIKTFKIKKTDSTRRSRKDNDVNRCHCIDWRPKRQNHGCYEVALGCDNMVYIVDNRDKICGQKGEFHRSHICGIKYHPLNEHYLMTGDNLCYVAFWDNRQLNKGPFCIGRHTNTAVKAMNWWLHDNDISKHIAITAGGINDQKLKIWDIDNGEYETRGAPGVRPGHVVGSDAHRMYKLLEPVSQTHTGTQVCNILCSDKCRDIITTHGYSNNSTVIWNINDATNMQIEFNTHVENGDYLNNYNSGADNDHILSNGSHYQAMEQVSKEASNHSPFVVKRNANSKNKAFNPVVTKLCQFIGHKSRVLYAAVNPDQTLLATAAPEPDNTIKIWKVFRQTKQCKSTIDTACSVIR